MSASVISPTFVKIELGYDCMKKANKCPEIPIPHWRGRAKVIWNPYPGTDRRQKLTSSLDCKIQSEHQVSVKSADYFCSNPAHRQTDRPIAQPPWRSGGNNAMCFSYGISQHSGVSRMDELVWLPLRAETLINHQRVSAVHACRQHTLSPS